MTDYANIKRWTHPKHYFGATWEGYYSAGVGRSRDSDALEESNFQAMLSLLGGESDTVIVVSESHWAVGWVEWIAVHESDTAALQAADEAMGRLADYPVLDEDAFSDLEWNRAADYWDSMTPRDKVQYAMDVRARYHWLANEPVWHYGRLDFGDLANYGSTISEGIYESLRE
jgi:hypothetical protein